MVVPIISASPLLSVKAGFPFGLVLIFLTAGGVMCIGLGAHVFRSCSSLAAISVLFTSATILGISSGTSDVSGFVCIHRFSLGWEANNVMVA